MEQAITEGTPGWLEGTRVVRLYRARGFQPLFITNAHDLRTADALLQTVDEAASHGLPFGYHLETVDAALRLIPRSPAPWWSGVFGRREANAREIARLDALLADRYLAFADDLRGARGRRVAPAARPDTEEGSAPPPAIAPDTVLTRLAGGPPPPVLVWAPSHPQYAALRRAWDVYHRIELHGGWPAVDPGETIRPGAHGERVEQIRARLAPEEDVLSGAPGSDAPAVSAVGDPRHFDDALVQRVRRFQATHALDADGCVGKGTVAEMNVSAADRVRQIEIALERWREGPRGEAPHRVEVNVPGMTARFYHDGAERLALKAVVGSGKESAVWKGKTSKAETPELVDNIETIEVNPRWYIPEIIVRTELLAKERKKPGFLDKGGYEWYEPKTGKHGPASQIPEADWSNPDKRLYLRQKSGRENSLGRIKFVFHNRYAVYLHDTPEKNLFQKARRNFSHGCVRVENPAALAESLVSYSSRKPAKPIAVLMADTARVVITLRPPVPIQIVYRTVWVDRDGAISFLPDIYGSDPVISRELFSAALPGARPGAAGAPPGGAGDRGRPVTRSR